MLFGKKLEREEMNEFQEETFILVGDEFVKQDEEVDSDARDPQERNE